MTPSWYGCVRWQTIANPGTLAANQYMYTCVKDHGAVIWAVSSLLFSHNSLHAGIKQCFDSIRQLNYHVQGGLLKFYLAYLFHDAASYTNAQEKQVRHGANIKDTIKQ